MSLAEQKEKLRQQLLEKRQAIPQARYVEASELITGRLKRDPVFQQARTIHCYISMNERREVNTHPLIRHILDDERSLVVPVTDFDPAGLRHIRLNSFEELEANKWGVPEPREGTEIDIAALDLVIVPMVGGDRSGNRIGYGKGFYDRFLAQVDGVAVGLCFDECIVEKIPTESFDVRLDGIVTQSGVIRQI